jgi:hypothetical protein
MTDPDEIYDALMLQIDPGMHHERELNQFYDRVAATFTYPAV